MTARRCSTCTLNWVNSQEYARCPRCEEPTSVIKEEIPMTPGHSRLIAKRCRFERFYEAHEDERERKGAPSPEELGQQQAFALVRGWHEVRVKLQ